MQSHMDKRLEMLDAHARFGSSLSWSNPSIVSPVSLRSSLHLCLERFSPEKQILLFNCLFEWKAVKLEKFIFARMKLGTTLSLFRQSQLVKLLWRS
jgi:hypothetical protein